jgi:adenylosuccinate lyase
MDQISEHQRDLSNSASQRFIADYVAGFSLAISRMVSIIEGLGANREQLAANLRSGNIPGGILAEPTYILLAESGVSDAHEVIRRITLSAEKEKLSFSAALEREPRILSRIGNKMEELGLIDSGASALKWFENPEQYRGLSVQKAKTLAVKYRKLMK